VGRRNGEGKQPLHLAVFAGSREIVERLVAAGADVGAPGNAGMSPLHVAALYDREEIAVFLLAHAARADARNNAGQTPAAVARQYRHERLAGLLDEQGRGRQQAAQSEGPSPEADRGVAP
jgi:ankyrin repeat protein